MTGGGFGGCTVNLIAPDRVEAFESHISQAYARAFSKEPQIYRCQPAAGAGEVV
jgi:galactokinase